MKQRFAMIGIVLASLMLVASPTLAADYKIVDLPEVEAMVSKKPGEGKYMLVDSRPEIKFFASHLPWAVSIPWTDMEDMLDELPADKSTKLVFYCGGLKCQLSHKAAKLALKNGYTDVSVFAKGEPAWRKVGKTPWVATNHIKILLNDPDKIALVVDSRPINKYNNGTVPGALSIPWPHFEKMKGLLPADKKTELIFFCGGFKCPLSHKSAAAARKMGYTNVRVYAEGYPAWKKKSTRAFAMVNPKNPGAAMKAEKIVYPGEIKKAEFKKLVKERPEGLLLVDCRPVEDFKKNHIPGAVNIPDEEIKDNLEQLKKAKQVVFYCATGSRSSIAYFAAEEGGVKGTKFLNAEIDYDADGNYSVK